MSQGSSIERVFVLAEPFFKYCSTTHTKFIFELQDQRMEVIEINFMLWASAMCRYMSNNMPHD